jgi:hypothetical protein
MRSTAGELAQARRRFETRRSAWVDGGVTWFASHGRNGEWTAEGIDTDGRRAGLIPSLDAPPRLSPDGGRVVAVSAAAGVDTRLTTFDASTGRLLAERAARSPFPRGAGDLDVEAAFTENGSTTVVLLTAVAHRPVAIVDKPDPDGGADEVAIGPWEIRRAIQVFHGSGGRVATVELPVQRGELAAARLSVAGEAVIVDTALARPTRANGTKTGDAGFDALRTTWHPAAIDPPTTTTIGGSTYGIPGNAMVLATTTERQIRLLHGRVLQVDDWTGAPPRHIALDLRVQAACMVDDRRVALSGDNGQVAIVDVTRRSNTAEVVLPGGAHARGAGAIAVEPTTKRIFVATARGIWVIETGELRVVDSWQSDAPFELVTTRGGRVLAKIDGAPVLLMLDGAGTARAVTQLLSRTVRALS